jgi:hypothetical protein
MPTHFLGNLQLFSIVKEHPLLADHSGPQGMNPTMHSQPKAPPPNLAEVLIASQFYRFLFALARQITALMKSRFCCAKLSASGGFRDKE